MTQEIHYEVFRRDSPKGGWQLHDVIFGRESALSVAESLIAGESVDGVRVVKETYTQETGEYLSLKIFEDGHAKMKVAAAAEDLPYALPCLVEDDLYSDHARATIARLLHEFLMRHTLTVTELLHRADALEKLEATGTHWQFAIQKVAVAQAASTTTPVQHIIRNLNELATRAAHRVYRDTRRGYFPSANPEQFGPLSQSLARETDGAYRLKGALARQIAFAKGWNEKLDRLLHVLSSAPGEGPGRTLLLSSLDSIIAEILRGAAALHDLLGGAQGPGEALLLLISLFLGHSPENRAADTTCSRLAGHFAADILPEARAAIGHRIVAELRSMRRLCPTSLDEELALVRETANRLSAAPENYLSRDNIAAAFTLRSRRLVTQDVIAGHLDAAITPDEKLERLLSVEEDIVGTENKRKLAAFAWPLVTSLAFEERFLSPNEPVLSRLKKLNALQARIRRSGIPSIQCNGLSHALDKTACEVEARAKLFQSLEEKHPEPAERVSAIPKLIADGFLTDGHLSEKARILIVGELRKPGFFTGYVSHLSRGGDAPDAQRAMEGLLLALASAGIPSAAGLKAIAA